jgi:hypothetical protein
MTLEEYYESFMQDIYARSDAEGNFHEHIFTERMCEFLVDHATLENYEVVAYKKNTKGLRVDAWNLDDDTGILNLLVADFRVEPVPQTLSRADAIKHFRRAERFLTESLRREFHQSLEETTPGYELARTIFEKSTQISRVRFFLLSSTLISSRLESIESSEIEGIRCTYDIWDISRLHRIEVSGKAREDTVIDFEEFAPTGLPCLPASTGSAGYESFLLAIPGKLISELYDRFGERLLEQNVRTFLQFRGNVNKGIRTTILNEPEMFFAYNNGLTATAESVNLDMTHSRLRSVTNLQIVNGGQTTASIFTAERKSRADLSRIYIQMKLTVVPPERVDEVVPKISEYANTQNKVSAADFFSNHPFHLRIEEKSRRIWAPSVDGGFAETHWFYERARGQYANAQAKLTPAEQKKFLTQFPKHQMFTKTDLAKFDFSLGMRPHVVSMGAQKSFAAFAQDIGQRWEKHDTEFNDLYFKQTIAKAIIFRYLDKVIMKQEWYGGYKANIVTYTIAKLAYMVERIGASLDLDAIWRKQSVSPTLASQLLEIAFSVNEAIQETPQGITNVTEWCKKEACWEKVQQLDMVLLDDLIPELLSEEQVEEIEQDAEFIQRIDNGIENQRYVLGKGAGYWKEVAQWGLKRGQLSEKEMGVLRVACQLPDKLPSEAQSKMLVKTERRLKKEGFFEKPDPSMGS